MSQVSKEFELAKESLKKLKNDPGNDVRLKLYGLFKQVNQFKKQLYYQLSIN